MRILTLALIASAAAASPQAPFTKPPNGTTTPLSTAADSPSSLPEAPTSAVIHTESRESGNEAGPSTASATTKSGGRVIHLESTQTGWENGDEPPRNTLILDTLVMVTLPILVTVHTEIRVPATSSQGEEDPWGISHSRSLATGTVPAVPQVTPGSDLLSDIVSHMGLASAPASQTDASPAPASPAPTEDLVTVGDATLALRPGLSTTVGAAVIAITTDTTGQTIVIVSSSGTAVSATIMPTVIVVTAPWKTADGFDTKITEAPRPADWTSLVARSAATSTSSRGGSAPRWKAGVGWWVGILGAIGALP